MKNKMYIEKSILDTISKASNLPLSESDLDRPIFIPIKSVYNAVAIYANQSKWVSEKPDFKEECIVLTATWIQNDWEYNAYLIKRIDTVTNEDGFYLGWCTLDGEEYGDLNDLHADLYQVQSLIPNP